MSSKLQDEEIGPDRPDLFAQSKSSLNHLLQRGVSLQSAGKLEEAIHCYQQILAVSGDIASAHNNLGVALKSQGQMVTAVYHYRQALVLNPVSANTHNNLGNALMALGRPAEAANCYQIALAQTPDNFETKRCLAETLSQMHFSKDKPVSAELLSCLIACLKDKRVEAEKLISVCNSILRYQLPEELLVKANIPPSATDIINRHASSAFMAFHNNELLLTFLTRALIADPAIEALLTQTRRELLYLTTTNDSAVSISKELKTFVNALAQQCFLNEYVWYLTETEEQSIQILRSRLLDQIQKDNNPDETALCLLGCYEPLHKTAELARWCRENVSQLDAMTQELIRLQVAGPLREHEIRDGIEQLTDIEDEVSQSVRDQYEENPYPRWASLSQLKPVPYTEQIRMETFQDSPSLTPATDKPKVLIAGCGTGRHPLSVAIRYRGAEVLAVDLSKTSLAYAIRKSEELGITNVRFAQADILKLDQLNDTFDVIESSGVLHHMSDPEAGLKVLLSMLKPGGFLKLGLYSEQARRHIVKLRSLIAERGFEPSITGIRDFRKAMSKEQSNEAELIRKSINYYSVSTVRDLLFHVQEHRFNILQLKEILTRNNLEFLGFFITNPVIKQAFLNMFPTQTQATNLDQWHEFELKNPRAFAAMYLFWTRKLK